MVDALSLAPSSLGLPRFVTHEPEGVEAKYISTLYTCAVQLGDDLCSAQAWLDRDLVRALRFLSTSFNIPRLIHATARTRLLTRVMMPMMWRSCLPVTRWSIAMGRSSPRTRSAGPRRESSASQAPILPTNKNPSPRRQSPLWIKKHTQQQRK